MRTQKTFSLKKFNPLETNRTRQPLQASKPLQELILQLRIALFESLIHYDNLIRDISVDFTQLFYRQFIKLRSSLSTDSGYLISYPKSGRTWLRLMLEEVNCKIKVSHHEGGFSHGIAATDISLKELDSNLPILFLFRNPIDTLVSSWFHVVNRSSLLEEETTLKKFLRHPVYGIEKIIRYNLMHIEQGPSFYGRFTCINYELMARHPCQALQEIYAFYKPRSRISRKSILNAVSKYNFDNMRKREMSLIKRFGVSFYGTTSGDAKNPNSLKSRRGIICGYYDYLDDHDIGFCKRSPFEI